ncbi:MAG: sodium:solute symporter family protein [Bacteroidales bacterium]|jgi:SSS family solute:Na+ symporter
MTLWGLHIIDLLILFVFLISLLWIGKRVSKKNRTTEDFFLAGRKLNRTYQFFLNFGCSTHADQTVAVTREIYRQGIGGMWIQFLVLFLTPFYWFSTFFFRRVRLVTIGDFFNERFRSKFLGAAYAIFFIIMSVLGGGVGYIVASKTVMAMTPKPVSAYTVTEKKSAEEFREFRELQASRKQGITDKLQEARYLELLSKNKKNGLSAFISYIKPIWFYLIFSIVVCVYTIMGGFKAAVITDIVQGYLIIIFSVILIPVGLARVGGFSGLHASVPDYMFQLFGSSVMSEYAWYTILAMVLANLVSIIAVSTGMQTAGSAKNEMTARLGMIGGMFAKRVIMILWALAGLIAIALYAGKLSDPDLIWGHMSNELLGPGLVGLMLAGILAATMSSLGALSLSYSALFIRNIYQPYFPGRSEEHYMVVGRVVIALTLAGGIGVALFLDNLLELFKYIISIPAIFGASIWLGFIWRRLTKWAVILQVIICLVIYTVIPNLFMKLDPVRYNPKFLTETRVRETEITTSALKIDVEKGEAAATGQKIKRTHVTEPVGIYFENVARINPDDPASAKAGYGRFQAEIWILSWFGIDFTKWTKPGLTAARFFFDALLPFVLLFLFSFFTQPEESGYLDRFYAKMYTPVQPTPEEDCRALEDAYANPAKYNSRKLFAKWGWEMLKPGKIDYLGFFGSCGLVGIIIFLLWLIVTIGR